MSRASSSKLYKKVKLECEDLDGNITIEYIKVALFPALTPKVKKVAGRPVVQNQAASNQAASNHAASNQAADAQTDQADDAPMEVSAPEETSKYKQKRTNVWEVWSALLPEFLNVHHEVQAPPSNATCTLCGRGPLTTIYRCMDCHPSPEAVLCATCIGTCHEYSKLHKPEVWETDEYQPFDLESNFFLPGHKDCSKVLKSVAVLDKKGRQHNKCTFHLCRCMKDVVQYFRMGFWPASPTKPSLLAELDMCALWDVLTLETNISISSFFASLNTLTCSTVDHVKRYRPFREGDSLHTYRVFSSVKNKVMNEPMCYACPKDNDNMIVSMDGNFGLVHKENAAKCTDAPLTRTILQEPLFIEQSKVDIFVNKQGPIKKVKGGECSQFQAADPTRSKNRAANLHYTGVFAISCRHEILIKMLNMRHGERFSYPVMLLKELNASAIAKNIKLLVLYDIACVFKPHIEKYHKDLAGIDMAIPVFHCYGHQGSCQLTMNPRRKINFGMSDGEWTERIWSFLRSFAAITKDQTTGHREDTLTIAALHMASKKNSVLEFTLYQKLKRVELLEPEVKLKLDSCLQEGEILDDVQAWQEQEIKNLEDRLRIKKQTVAWEDGYMKNLKDFSDICERVKKEKEDAAMVSLLQTKDSLDQKLKTIELKEGIERWEQGCDEFVTATLKQQIKKQDVYWEKIHRLLFFKQIYQEAQRKHADDQSSHERVSRTLAKNCKTLQKIVEAYNSEGFVADQQYPTTLEEDDVRSMYSFLKIAKIATSDMLPPNRRDAVTYYELWQRIREEKTILLSEVNNVLKNFAQCYYVLDDKIVSEPVSQYQRGYNALCIKTRNVLAQRIANTVQLFPEIDSTHLLYRPNTADGSSLSPNTAEQAACFTDADIAELALDED